MSQKMSMALALALCSMFAVAPMNVSAYSIRTSDKFVIEKDDFQYDSGIQDDLEMVHRHGGYLNITDVDANFMVTGVFHFEDDKKYYVLYPVNEINEVNTPELVKAGVGYYHFGSDTRGGIEAKYLDALLDGKELAIGDLVKMQNYFVAESMPLQYSIGWVDYDENGNELIPSAEYVGNALELFGEEFKDVLINEMYIAPNYLIGQLEVRESYELVDSNHIVKKGDVIETGEVNIVDVLATNQYLLGVYQPSNYGILAGDVNHNGTVDDGDALTILKSLVGLETLE